MDAAALGDVGGLLSPGPGRFAPTAHILKGSNGRRSYAGGMPEWITDGAALMALALSVTALVYTRRATRAAEVSADQAKRANQLSEQQIAQAREREEELRRANAIRWSVERSGDLLHLRNVGTETAHDVAVELDDPLTAESSQLPRGEVTLAPGESTQLLITEHWGGPIIAELPVSCREQSAPAYVGVPPKP